ncbi:MAG TPA: AAA family ATPase [Xanthomonadales bacterium]|nr:AAA family ATPase [Xanthomonadales bacterium]
MYLEFFGLREAPFSITPDPRFVFLSERHRDALAHLLYGIGQGGSGGFVQLTGEVGTGKTTLSRLLLEQLPENTRVALVLNPKLSPVELLESVCEELKLDVGEARGSLKQLVDLLNHFLLDAYAQGLRVVLIVDEAQNLSIDSLEQVRLLTNLETPTQKLLQIILLGQPELRDMLEKPELRQLAQRITARYHLTPLDEDETEAYLRHRLAVAGGQRFPFSRLAVRSLHRRSGGVPRLLNVIAERALLAGYVVDEAQVSERLVEHAANEVLGRAQRVRRRYVAAAAVVLALAAGTLWATWRPQEPPARPVPVAQPVRASAPAPSVEDAVLTAALAELPPDAELAAWSHLLALWQVDTAKLTVREAARCPTRIYPGLSCLRGSGNLAKLRTLDRPVLLALSADGRTRLALLLGIDAQRAQLDVGTRTLVVSLAALDAHWLGQYYAVFKAPGWLPEHVRRGDGGGAVAWVTQRLPGSDKLGASEAGPPVFDAATESRVRDLQATFGLQPDGIVGPETALALASRESGGPRLATRFPSAAEGTKTEIGNRK